ncbi:MAG TPA: phosphoserine phosphatase, partial [Methanosarcina sp.]|nr:phosphoserine phosphatase [Methanosarcina sp.]
HREFVKAQEAADEQHKAFINAQKEIRDLDKEIFKLKRKDKDGKSRIIKSELQKDAKSIFEKFKGGAKLTTEDLMTLQRSGLV